MPPEGRAGQAHGTQRGKTMGTVRPHDRTPPHPQAFRFRASRPRRQTEWVCGSGRVCCASPPRSQAQVCSGHGDIPGGFDTPVPCPPLTPWILNHQVSGRTAPISGQMGWEARLSVRLHKVCNEGAGSCSWCRATDRGARSQGAPLVAYPPAASALSCVGDKADTGRLSARWL